MPTIQAEEEKFYDGKMSEVEYSFCMSQLQNSQFNANCE